MLLEDLALIGNCQISALVEKSGSIVWCCMPRFDSEPVFSTILDADKGGHFLVGAANGEAGVQRYLDNTNVAETTFRTVEGSFRVIDFAPRFERRGRMVRPTCIVRIVEPLGGTPRAIVRCDPRLGWSGVTPERIDGSQVIRFEGFPAPVTLSTDIPLAYFSGHPFPLTERRYMVFSWGAPVEEPLEQMCDRHLTETVRHWQRWVKHCEIPPFYQREVIRSALTLKLHCFEDTGAIVAALTTSIPEAPSSGRTWDYRYCWLRDAYYVLGALRLLGQFEEREAFVNYLIGIAAGTPDLALLPLYRVDGTSADLEERTLPEWAGFAGSGPVRVGNAAALQPQNDIFGEMVLALTPVFLDDRFAHEQSPMTLDLLERLTRKAIAVAGSADAGIWEFRADWKPQTFSTLMCWAAADRMAKVAARHMPGKVAEFEREARRIRDLLVDESWNEELQSLVATHGGQDLDAALLQAAPLRLLAADDPRLRSTIDAIWKSLARSGWLLRYRLDDGFGKPAVAFIICTFWLVEALVAVGSLDAAKKVMDHVHSALSPLGLMSEDYDASTLRMWGNFPQAYSHVGLIHAAFASSIRWSDVL